MNRRTFIKINIPLVLAGHADAQAAAGKPALAFGVIADPQYADIPAAGSRHYRNSIAKMNAAIDELNKHQLDFVVTLGDVIDRDLNSFRTMMPLYEKLTAPRRFVLGNHDFGVAPGDKGKVMATMNLPAAYHAETINGWHLIFLDGTEVSTYRYPADNPKTKSAGEMRLGLERLHRPQSQPWNGALGETQMTWLAQELKSAGQNNKRVIVFNHFPVYPLNQPHNLWNDADVVTLLASFPNVVAYMNGHNHQGNYAVHKGCHYVNFKGMVETPDTTAFAIVRCHADHVEIDGHGTEPDRALA